MDTGQYLDALVIFSFLIGFISVLGGAAYWFIKKTNGDSDKK